jgi:hypothetical protein
MRTLFFLCLTFFIASCSKENDLPKEAEAAVANGYNLIVPKEIYINDQLTQINSYENGRIKQSLFPGGTGVATYTYDDVNNTTTSSYTEDFYRAVTVDTYDEERRLLSSVSTGEYLDFGGSFHSVTTNTYLNNILVQRQTVSDLLYPGFESKTEYNEKFFYQGPKLEKIESENKRYENGILQFIENQQSIVTWQNSSNFTLQTAGNQQTIMEFSPKIKSPFFYTGEMTHPREFKNQDHRQLKKKFEVSSNMLRTFFSSANETSGSTSSISVTKMNKSHFPEEYIQEDIGFYGDMQFKNTTRMKFVYIEIAPKN